MNWFKFSFRTPEVMEMVRTPLFIVPKRAQANTLFHTFIPLIISVHLNVWIWIFFFLSKNSSRPCSLPRAPVPLETPEAPLFPLISEIWTVVSSSQLVHVLRMIRSACRGVVGVGCWGVEYLHFTSCFIRRLFITQYCVPPLKKSPLYLWLRD